MALDPRFVVTSDLEEYFVDKDTGLPLAGGIVTFYSDINRTTKKPVYQITGSPPNYTYAVLQNPVVLSDVGTFQDSLGNNIVPYYFPYQGTPSSSTGIIELYYITVQSAGFVQQFTREGWPNFTAADASTGEDFNNLIPNGQFLAHNDIVSATEPPVLVIGGVDYQAIAQGGWWFRHTHGGTSVFNNSFQRITTGISGLNDFPRYAFNFECTSFNSNDQVRDLTILWADVNKFSSGNPVGTQDFTFFFAGESKDSNTYSFDIRMIQYFGTGGSPSTTIDTSIGSVQISPGYSYYTLHITGFPANSGTIGTNNDDFIGIALRGPSSSWNVQVTDFALLIGNVAPVFFPIQTDASMLSEGVAGFMTIPDPTGLDLFLPLILTPSGMEFDRSQIGKVFPTVYTTPGDGELLCDGSKYETAGYSALGIPYSRLQAKIYNATVDYPIFGTGSNYFNARGSIVAALNQILIANNDPGATTATTQLAAVFTIATIHAGANYGVKAFNYAASSLLVVDSTIGVAPAGVAAGTSGFTVGELFNSASVKQVFAVTTVAAAGLANTYFTFTRTGGGTFYMWFAVSGTPPVDPAPGGFATGIRVDLLNTYGAPEVAAIVQYAISGNNLTTVLLADAATIPQNYYMTVNASTPAGGQVYYVWYNKDGAGTDPAPGGIGIEVDITTGQTDAQVTTATYQAINRKYFAVPDFRGAYLRGWNNSQPSANINYDPNVANRFSALYGLRGDNLGTTEYFQIYSHSHSTVASTTLTNLAGTGAQTLIGITGVGTTNPTLSATGGDEVRTINQYVNYVIKY